MRIVDGWGLAGIVLAFFLVSFLMVGLVVACDSTTETDPRAFAVEGGVEGDSFQYWSLEIEGMPCKWVQYADTVSTAGHLGGFAGLSCDWRVWEGNVGE